MGLENSLTEKAGVGIDSAFFNIFYGGRLIHHRIVSETAALSWHVTRMKALLREATLTKGKSHAS